MKIIQKLKNIYKEKRIEFRLNQLLSNLEKENYTKIAKILKKQKTYFEIKINTFPFIYYMINEGKKEGIETLLKKVTYSSEILMNEKNEMNITPIGFAYLENKDQIVQMIEKYGGNIHQPNSQMQNILHLAAIYQRQQAFKKGIHDRIDFNLPDIHGNTPFHYACRVGSVEMIATCIAGKAKKLMNANKQYPIHMAVESGNLNCVQLLMDDINKPYPQFHLIHSATRSRSIEMVDFILQKKPASLNYTDHQGLTPLHHAVIVEDEPIFDFLMSKSDILVDKQDVHENTPLHLAFFNNNIRMISSLVHRKANLQVLNEDQMSPVDYGISSGKAEIHSFLKQLSDRSQKIREWMSVKY